MARIISASEVLDLSRRPGGGKLLDVRSPGDFEAARLPGALNQCVFEVVFLEGIAAKGLAPEESLCVYGAGEDSHEARVAAEKLERAGFTSVLEFRGGLDAWKAAGYPLESSAPGTTPAPRTADGRLALDLTESRVVWLGRNLVNKHWGTVALAGGHVDFSAGLPRSGEAVLDLTRITCSDLAGNALHEVLIDHLESDDFFDVARFPTARFAFDETEVIADRPGQRNLRLLGQLTLRGVTRPLVIEAAAGFTPEGRAALQAAFSIDRTDWGVIYGSGRFFRSLAGHLVNDEIELQLRVVTSETARD